MPKLNMVEALNLALMQEMKKDKDVIILGEDVGVDGGVFRVTDGLQKKYKQRVIDTPVAESAIIGTAIGMSIYGLKPIAEIQFSGFIPSAFNQIINHASRFRTRSRAKYTCQMVIRSPYSGGVKALEHHSESMEAIYAHIPGLKVVIPSSPYNAKGLLISAIRDKDPILFLEPKRIYRSFKQEVPNKEYIIEIGKANIVKQGNDLTIIAWGSMLHLIRNIVDRLSDVDAELIDLRTISPLDTNTIIESVKKTKRCLIVHEAPRNFGPAGEIIARINEHCFECLDAPVKRVCGMSTVIPLYKLEKNYFPNEKRIIRAISELINY